MPAATGTPQLRGGVRAQAVVAQRCAEELSGRAGSACRRAEALCTRSRDLIEQHTRIYAQCEFYVRGRIDDHPVVGFWWGGSAMLTPRLRHRADLIAQIDGLFEDSADVFAHLDPCIAAALTVIRACDKVERFTCRPSSTRTVDFDSAV